MVDKAKTYFTGKPCKRGHVAPRWKSTRQCTECLRANVREWKRENQEKDKAATAAWRDGNKEYNALKKKEWAEENRERVKLNASKWRAENQHKLNQREAARRARIRSQICSCCTKEEFTAFYKAAAERGLTVDHIIPLHHGGPHCVHNLQMMTLAENSSKYVNFGAAEMRKYILNLVAARG